MTPEMTPEEKRIVASVMLFWALLTGFMFADILGPSIALILQWWAANR